MLTVWLRLAMSSGEISISEAVIRFDLSDATFVVFTVPLAVA